MKTAEMAKSGQFKKNKKQRKKDQTPGTIFDWEDETLYSWDWGQKWFVIRQSLKDLHQLVNQILLKKCGTRLKCISSV